MATSPPPINQFTGAVPQRGDKSTFSARVDAFVTWLIAFVVQLPALAANVYANALEAFQSAGTATAAAAAAVAAANASQWVSGTTYAINACAISQVNFQTYRKITAANSTTTDPANDSTNWRILTGNGANGVFTPLPSTVQLDLSKSNYFVVTLSTSSTLSIINCPPGGYAFVVELVVTGGSLTLPSSVRTPSDAALGLTVGKTHMLVFSTSNGGARFKLSSSLNFNVA